MEEAPEGALARALSLAALVVALFASFWLVLLRPSEEGPSRPRAVPDPVITDAEDEHWPVAHVDEHTRVERGVAVKLASGRVVRGDVARFYPEDNAARQIDGKRRVLLFIPGNPGLVDFYMVFLRKIFDRTGGRAYVCAVGHAGHSGHSHGREREISYEEQIEHKVAFLRQEFPGLERAGDVEIFLSGHSVGARIGLEMMHRLHGEVHFAHYFGLCPTVMHIAKSPNGLRATDRLANSSLRGAAYWALHALAPLVRVLPRSLVHRVSLSLMARDCPTVNEYYAQHGPKLVDPYVVRNVLAMANDEMQMILGEEDASIQHAVSNSMDRISFVLSPVDRWCDGAIVESMRGVFHGSAFTMLGEDVKHAFCLSHDSVEQVVAAMMEDLESAGRTW